MTASERMEKAARQVLWNANKRTIDHLGIHDELIAKVDELLSNGDFDGATRELEAQPEERMSGSAGRGWVRLALARFGAGDGPGALEALDRADRSLRRTQAGFEINRANILKVMGQYDAALAAGRRACDADPAWFGGYLAVIAVLESRGEPADIDEVRGTLTKLSENSPGAIDDPELRDYISNDVDFARVNADPYWVGISQLRNEEALDETTWQ